MNNEQVSNQIARTNSFALKKLWGLIRWSLVRHKYLISAFSLVQAVFAIAIVYGLALLIPEIDAESAVYLSSGAITLGMIAVGCVLAPQIASTSKQNGLFDYQRTLPVSRSSILLADIIIWSVASLPGIMMSCLATVLRFQITIHVTPSSIFTILITQITMICIGFAIAYWLPPNAMALATQIIMIGGLLFSPITYPIARLPEWTTYIYQVLPFVPTSNLIRATLFQSEILDPINLIVVLGWAVVAFIFALMALAKRK
ncbi:ABC transporter permease [Isobaculum melis]|uniref:ABC-2 type transport system permease protein n=1 Tax=Isobaculum melis TaxID=142588 RepID=A0A1H9Q5N8_9LACT|nr:ABC transporter permease [Isobaculum melis]SER55445.1 ABC-2 type transport system permease protein [Isobaculum melis]